MTVQPATDQAAREILNLEMFRKYAAGVLDDPTVQKDMLDYILIASFKELLMYM